MSQREQRPAAESVVSIDSDDTSVSLDRALLDWSGAQRRAGAYLSALGLRAAAARRAARDALERALARSPRQRAPDDSTDSTDSTEEAIEDTMDELPGVLMREHPLAIAARSAPPEDAFRSWRFAAWRAGGVPDGATPMASALAAPLEPTPPLLRGTLTAEHFRGRRLGERGRRRKARSSASDAAKNAAARAAREERRAARRAWGWRGRGRRALLGILVAVPSVLAGVAFLLTLPAEVWLPAEIALAVFFGALFGWISMGFWTAVFGFVVMLRGGDRFAITRGESGAVGPLDASFRTAIAMPICDESVERVFAGLRATRSSLARAGAADAFDVFVLSDSVDPDICVEEEAAWAEWRRSAERDGGGGIFYRRRRVRRKRKSGNVADFCRRFGRRYRYMIVLDADSIMSGDALVRLVRLMESHPHVGIIQTAPTVVRARSLFARIQQFAGRLYGPMFAAGMHYWQLGDSPYWGHNAILRVAPFMKHCGLPRLSGKPPLGGDILSHDFVEAAMLGRAGWSIWLAFDLPGSYEETPGSLLEEMQRDRRWCQGNLQHLRLLFTEGLATAHRALFLNGIFSYVSAVLWLGFLVASTTEAVMWALRGPDYFASTHALFPTWPVWRPERAMGLFAAVAIVLLLPKLLAVALAVRRGEVAGFGGFGRLLRSVAVEALASALFAPIRMAFYCRFVLLNLVGRAVGWKGGADELQETSWWTALRRHGVDTVVACCWALTIHWLDPAAFWWLAPVAGALALSVPSSVLASRVRLGERARSAGWLVTPEELEPPAEARLEDGSGERAPEAGPRFRGFRRAVADPLFNAVHIALLRGPRSLRPDIRAARRELVERALARGPDALSDLEKQVVLYDAPSLDALHRRVWRLGRDAAQGWGLDGEVEPPREGGRIE